MNPTTQVLEERLAALRECGGALRVVWIFCDSVSYSNVASAVTILLFHPIFMVALIIYLPIRCPKWASKSALLIRPMLRALRGSAMNGLERILAKRFQTKACSFPIAEVADLGVSRGIPLIVDNTAAPLTCRPIEHGQPYCAFLNKVYRWTWHIHRRCDH